MKILKVILFTVGILLLFFLIYQAGSSEIIKVIKGAKLYFIILGALLYLTALFVRSLKWFFLIKKVKKRAKFKKFLPIYLINCLISNTTPFKSGQALVPFLFKKHLKIPLGFGFSVIIFDGFFEVVIFLGYLFVAVIYLLNTAVKNSFILSFFGKIFIVLILFIFFAFLLISYKKIAFKIIKFISFFKKYKILKKIPDFIEKETAAFYKAVDIFKNIKIFGFIICLTFFAWILEFISFYFVFSSVFKTTSFLEVVSAQIMAIAAIFATFIPGGIGINETSVVYILGLLNYPFILSASAMLINRFLVTGGLIIIGLIGFLMLKQKNIDKTL